MNPTLRDLNDDFFFDSESRGVAFHSMREPKPVDYAFMGILLVVGILVMGAYGVGRGIRGLLGHS